MYTAISKNYYKFITECEILFLTRFRQNPFDIMNKMSILDLKFYIDLIALRIKEEYKGIDKKSFIKYLIGIRDMLNIMFPEEGVK